MKRSEINRHLAESLAFLQKMGFAMPPWATWSPADWRGKAQQTEYITRPGLGWDITDFGGSDFSKRGLIMFTMRNGIPGVTLKTYCEKMLIAEENQVTPLHTHRNKVEDIINRGGGRLVIELRKADEHFRPTDEPLTVLVDSMPVTVPAGGHVVLAPGQSICLEPGMLHQFYGEPGRGTVLLGEVSTVNDDVADNVFPGGNPRFPTIEEDAEPLHLLITDYPNYL